MAIPHSINLSLEERFWMGVCQSDDADACWPWVRSLSPRGYGKIMLSRPRKLEGTHRMAWILANGRAIPDGLYVCHRCDNPKCCRPSHLFLGTATDNVRDMVAKGRSRRRLNDDQVREIRIRNRSGESFRSIGQSLQMNVKSIYNIIHGKSYRDVV